MFINWFRSEARTAASHDEHFFVQKVSVPRRRHPVDRFIVGGWVLILIKCVLASIAIHRWHIPIDDFFVWGPSVIFGALCTFLYLTREER